MLWHDHSKLNGTHAFLSPSKPQWMNDSDEELISRKVRSYSAPMGTILHAFAESAIRHKFRINKADKRMLYFHLIQNGIPDWAIDIDSVFYNLQAYVNDAISLRMTPEQVLYYSDECYGTADAISFKDDHLLIFDLKTGTTPAHIEQLEVYAGLFCLEYEVDPYKITTDLRIYQSDQVLMHSPEPQEIRDITDHIIFANKVLTTM